eukprot:CAMPEP_0182449980 /NCGR_PEP_ID=MMETSP1172-20130603/38089_1 /TAXON_ID=708627 /ORGANISM="Timspurckia oligopyrenoides, Strain CCMP3278" /LENGTH=266 /DNA_ID=CAMNT_0024647427 /DNA_START=119 /DNA_END=919 /DNA_ORIENTATION=+
MATSEHNFYDVLGVSKDASTAEIKRAYRLLVVRVHPDKSSDHNATEKFQQLQRVYETLADDEKRKLYDESGCVWDDPDSENLFSGKSFEQLYSYFRSMYKKIDTSDIESYRDQYRGGKDEEEDIMDFYSRYNGKVSRIIDYIPYSEESDLQRFVELIDSLVEAKKLEKMSEYTKSRKDLLKRAKQRPQNVKPEPKEVSSNEKHKFAGADNALVLAIEARNQQREQQMDSFFDSLAAKYAPKKRQKNNKSNATKAIQKTPKSKRNQP